MNNSPTKPTAEMQYNRHVTDLVELSFELDDSRVDQCALLTAWDELLPFSVEAAIVNRPSLFEFASTHSLLFAAVLVPLVEFEDLPPAPPRRGRPNRNGIHAKSSKPSEKGDQFKQPDGTDDAEQVVRRGNRLKTAGVVYVSQSAIPQQAYIGIGILPTFRGKGIARRACDLMLERAFDALQTHHIQARIMSSPYIARARSLFVAAGFTFEGVQRRVVTNAAGEWADVMHMGILDTAWCIHTNHVSTTNGPWDELLERHQREAEELLLEETRRKSKAGTLRQTDSMEAIRVIVEPQGWDSDYRDRKTRSPSPLSATPTASPSRSPSRASESSTDDSSDENITPHDTNSEDNKAQP